MILYFDAKRLKKGALIRVRKDLEFYKEYSGVMFYPIMQRVIGKVIEFDREKYSVYFDDMSMFCSIMIDEYYLSFEMMELVNEHAENFAGINYR